MVIITRDFLAQYLRGAEVSTYTREFSPVDFDVEVSNQNKALYKYQALDSHLLVLATDEQKNDLIQVLDRSGMYELEVEFNPSSEAKIVINDGRIELPDETYIPAKIRTSDPTFNRWFQKACALLGHKVYLIPDTNVSKRMYYTNYLRSLLVENAASRSMSILIPRLGMLEIENMYIRNKPGEKSLGPRAKQKDKDSYKENEKRKAKERRIAFQSMGEILSMKNDGAKVLSHVDTSLISSFTPEAGKGNADAWIRKEISNNKPDLAKANRIRQDTVETSNLVFLTCDLMNSLAATAEDLNTIYFYRLEDKIRPSIIGYDKLSPLIFNTAVHFEECEIVIRGKGKMQRFRCKGVWSGKSVYDWQNNHIHIDRLTNS